MSSSSWNLKFSLSSPLSRKWNDIVRLKQSFQLNRSDPSAFRPKFCFLISEAGLETRIFGNGTVSLGCRTDRPVTTSGVVDHFDRRISTRIKAFHLFLDRNFRIFRVMERTQKPPKFENKKTPHKDTVK